MVTSTINILVISTYILFINYNIRNNTYNKNIMMERLNVCKLGTIFLLLEIEILVILHNYSYTLIQVHSVTFLLNYNLLTFDIFEI